MIVEGFPNRTIIIDGKKYLYFGGTSYLGMATHKYFLEKIYQNLLQWGASYGSSRNANIKLGIYQKAEGVFAKQLSAESSLIVSSGTLAGKLVTEHLSNEIDQFYHYPKTHPAVLVKNSIPLFVEGKLHANLLNDVEEEIVITADAILGLETQPTSFEFLNEIAPQKKITLIIDESHTLGIVGKNGKGVFDSVSSNKIYRKILVSSLGKALSLPCGIIASDNNFIELLKGEPLYISSSGANPAYLAAYIESLDIYKNQQKKLKQNLAFISSHLLRKPKLHFSNNYPVIYSNSDTIFRTLYQNNIIISSFKYPTYTERMNRIVITSNHTEADLYKLIDILNKIEL